MAKSGEYSDVLRAIGRLLDLQGAQQLNIVDEGPFLRASWEVKNGGQERRIYRAFEIDRLRLESRMQRSGSGDGVPEGGLAETLRTIGAEIDRSECELLSLAQTEDGFQVSMMLGGGHLTRNYTAREIASLTIEQRARRRPQQGNRASA